MGLQRGYYAAERHANLALLSLKRVAATPKGLLGDPLVVCLMALPLTKGPPVFYAEHRRLVAP